MKRRNKLLRLSKSREYGEDIEPGHYFIFILQSIVQSVKESIDKNAEMIPKVAVWKHKFFKKFNLKYVYICHAVLCWLQVDALLDLEAIINAFTGIGNIQWIGINRVLQWIASFIKPIKTHVSCEKCIIQGKGFLQLKVLEELTAKS